MALDLEKVRANRDLVKEEMARRNVNFYEFRDGRNVLRILPPWEGADDFSRKMGKHWGLGPEGKTMVFCPNVCFSKPCPICNELEKKWKAKPDDATKEWLKRVSATPRFLVNVIDMKDIASGIQVAEFPKTVVFEVYNIMVDEDSGYGDVTNPETGHDIMIDKSGTGIGTRYAVRAKREASAIPPSISLDAIPNLDALVRNETYENLKLIWDGKDPDEVRALPAPAAIPVASAFGAGEGIIDTVKVGDTHMTPAPPDLPECFENFNEDDPVCLDCFEQDECEVKMLKAKRAAKAAAPPAAAPAVKRAEKAAPVSTTISADDLMKEMEAAISR